MNSEQGSPAGISPAGLLASPTLTRRRQRHGLFSSIHLHPPQPNTLMQYPYLALAALATLATTTLPAQSATFTTYGSGCGTGSNPCIAENWGQPFSGNGGVTRHFAMLFNTSTTPRVVCGVEFVCARTAGPIGVNVSIFDRSTSGQPGKALATAVMQVTTTPQANKAIFTTPLILTANTDYFVVFDNSVGLRMPIVTSGNTVTHYWNWPTTWSGPANSARWSFRVLCCGGGPVPTLSNTGLPAIGKSFSIDLKNATANAKVLFAVGAVQTSLPLAPAGAPGCTLYTDPLAVFPLTADGQGNASASLGVPNDRLLIGLGFYSQFAVVDSTANALQLLFSNGGAGKLGT